MLIFVYYLILNHFSESNSVTFSYSKDLVPPNLISPLLPLLTKNLISRHDPVGVSGYSGINTSEIRIGTTPAIAGNSS